MHANFSDAVQTFQNNPHILWTIWFETASLVRRWGVELRPEQGHHDLITHRQMPCLQIGYAPAMVAHKSCCFLSFRRPGCRLLIGLAARVRFNKREPRCSWYQIRRVQDITATLTAIFLVLWSWLRSISFDSLLLTRYSAATWRSVSFLTDYRGTWGQWTPSALHCRYEWIDHILIVLSSSVVSMPFSRCFNEKKCVVEREAYVQHMLDHS